MSPQTLASLAHRSMRVPSFGFHVHVPRVIHTLIKKNKTASQAVGYITIYRDCSKTKESFVARTNALVIGILISTDDVSVTFAIPQAHSNRIRKWRKKTFDIFRDYIPCVPGSLSIRGQGAKTKHRR